MIQDRIMNERRADERVLARCPIRFKAERENVLDEGSSKDISNAGLGLFTRTRLTPQSQVEMWVELTPRIKPLNISGRVIWAEQRHPILWQAGIRFEEKAFVKLVKMLMSRNSDYKSEVNEDV